MKHHDTGGHAMKRTTTLLAIAALTMTLLGATAALAQQYPPRPGPIIEVTVVVTTPAGRIVVDGSNWGPGTTVCIEKADGTVVGSPQARAAGECPNPDDTTAADFAVVTADEQGSFSAELEVPADTEPGDLTYVAAGVDEAGEPAVREIVLSVDDDGDIAASVPTQAVGQGGAVAATAIDGTETSSFLTLGNSLLALLVIIGAALLLFIGPLRHRRRA